MKLLLRSYIASRILLLNLLTEHFPKNKNKQEKRSSKMQKSEIAEFIESMEEIGDNWTEEQVKDVYGDMSL